MQHKYIRHDSIGFILWPRTDELFHSDVAHSTIRSAGGRVISAGFCSIVDGARCFGRSGSLDMDSLPEDSAALAAQLGIEVAQQADKES